MRDSRLLIYHHLPKSGGTSLRTVVRENYEPDEVAELYSEVATLHSESAALGVPADERRWYRAWYESLEEAERQRLKCVSSHTANQLIPSLDRQFRAFCLLRDPVEHVWSLYHFVLSLAEREGSRGRGAESGREFARRGWDLVDLYRELGGGGPSASALHERFRGFFNGQTRSIISPWIEQAEIEYWRGLPGPAQKLEQAALDVLNRHYVVGVYEQYDRSLARFAAEFGWSHVDAPRLNVSAQRGRPDSRTREMIREHNRIDAELHAHFSA